MSTIADVIAGRAKWCAVHGDARDVLPSIPSGSIDAVVTDPIYPEIERHYGRITADEWWGMMIGEKHAIVPEVRRALSPKGSAVFILQANSERVGRMRAWLPRFEVWMWEEWGCPQDVYWWNFTAPPTVHCHRARGLMRPSVKRCVWGGAEDCYRNQDVVLWTQSDANAAQDRGDRALLKMPGGLNIRRGRACGVADERGGVTPFNIIPISNAASVSSAGEEGHGAGTPYDLAAWWIRYICPPDGIVLDPFGGAGTMARAAVDQGRRCILIERDSESMPRIERTMNRSEIRAAEKAEIDKQTTIFDMLAPR